MQNLVIMSRIGKKPITIEEGVNVTVENHTVKVVGPKGNVEVSLPEGVAIKVSGNQVEIQIAGQDRLIPLQGLSRSLVSNAIYGVKTGWSKTLELVGVGFRAQTDGRELTMNLGFSHPVKITAPEGVNFAVSENKITVMGADKYLVGEIAASIRRVKKPEPYKGKGIKYVGEYIRKKLGKAAKAVGGGVAGAK